MAQVSNLPKPQTVMNARADVFDEWLLWQAEAVQDAVLADLDRLRSRLTESQAKELLACLYVWVAVGAGDGCDGGV